MTGQQWAVPLSPQAAKTLAEIPDPAREMVRDVADRLTRHLSVLDLVRLGQQVLPSAVLRGQPMRTVISGRGMSERFSWSPVRVR